MKITKQMLTEMSNFAKDNYSALKVTESSTFVAECWVEAFIHMLSKHGYDAYAFEKNYNEKIADPQKFIDISGKLQVK